MIRFHWFTYKHKKGDEESNSDSDANLDDDDIANSDGVISESISSLLQVVDITLIWADDPVFKKKEFPGFISEKHLYDELRELCNLRF